MPRRRTGKIIVTLSSTEKSYDYADLGVTFDSSTEQILDAVQPMVLESEGVDILEDGLYTVKKVDESRNTYLFPKSPMGVD